MNLGDLLITKAKNNTLGHFYIIETSTLEGEAQGRLLEFIENFIHRYYQEVEGMKNKLPNLLDYPDVLVIGNTHEEDKDEKAFKVPDVEGFSRFFEFKAVQSKRKFAIITEAHRITPTIANKWLKLFEEPNGDSTIFLLSPRGGQLLPTIHSRAIHLRLASQSNLLDFSQWNEFIKDVQALTIAPFLDKYSKGKIELGFWINEYIRWEASRTDGFDSKSEFTEWFKNFQEMELFYQTAATKWTLFYSFLKEHVTPRLN